jgi:molybdopterin converting factor small subunit
MRVEFLGLPRERAGVAEVELRADTLGQLLDALVARFPSFGELVDADALRPSFVANLNGDRFVSDPRTALLDSDCVLILSADAGG